MERNLTETIQLLYAMLRDWLHFFIKKNNNQRENYLASKGHADGDSYSTRITPAVHAPLTSNIHSII